MRYIKAPQPFEPDSAPSLYLAGQVTGCPDWQSQALTLLSNAGFNGTVLNPRPSTNPGADPYAPWRPFGWQSRTIRRADLVLFWQPIGPRTVIDLYEQQLTGQGGAIVVGCDTADPDQESTRDQLHQVLPWPAVHATLADTIHAALARLATPIAARI